jgi:hypothetical protein
VLKIINTQANANKRFVLKLGDKTSAPLTFANSPLKDAEAIRVAVAGLLGVASPKTGGPISVTWDTSSNVSTFTISFSGALAALDIGQITAERVPVASASLAPNTLLFNAQTLAQGNPGYTREDQAALIQIALDTTFGEGQITVSVAEDGSYLLAMNGRYANANVEQMRVITDAVAAAFAQGRGQHAARGQQRGHQPGLQRHLQEAVW